MKMKRLFSMFLCMVLLTILLPATAPAAGDAPEAGSGTAADPYIIDEPSELVWMSENYSSIREKYFRQTADINMIGIDFTPIGNGSTDGFGSQFAGIYDGQGFEIQNLTINSNLAYVALFQYLDGTVKNVTLTNASITSTATYNYSSAAGIAGYLASGTIQNCGVAGTISLTGAATYSYTAGIAGTTYGTVQDCFSTAALNNVNSGASIGGIAAYTGNVGVNILRCYFAGSISGAATTKGGVVGNAYQGTIADNVFLSSAATYGRASSSSNEGCMSADAATMKASVTYTGLGWDFTNVWKINEGTDYPRYSTEPYKPQNLTAVPDSGQVTLSWDAAERASSYLVYYGTASGAYGTPVPAAGTSAVINGLDNNTIYYFAVKGLHVLEEGPLSDEVTCSPHDMITDLIAVPEDGRVDLTFSAPVGADTVELQQSHEGGPFAAVESVSLTEDSTAATVTGLVNTEEYSFRLRLVYGGDEYFSNTVTVYAGNGDATLSALTVSGCDLSPVFASGTYSYSAAVAPGINSVSVTATLSSEASSLYFASSSQTSGIPGAVSLRYGVNMVHIRITAQNGDYLVYTVNIIRELPTGTVTKIADLSIDNVNYPPFQYVGEYSDSQENAALKFDLSAYTDPLSYVELGIYTSDVDSMGDTGMFQLYGSDDDSWTTALPSSHDTSPISSSVTRPDTTADCWITMDVTDYVKNHLATLDSIVTFYLEGIRNETDIAFFPADSTQVEYRPRLVLVFQSNDARLSGISIGGTPLSDFSPDTNEYSHVAPYGTDPSALVLTSTVNDAGAGQSSWTYDSANRKWSITVTSEDGTTTKTYTVTVIISPAITSVTYNTNTGILTVTGENFLANAGAGNDIDVLKLTVTGEGGASYTLTSPGIELDSSTQFTVTLSAADKAAVNQFMNKNGTASTSGTAYNLAAADDWCTAVTLGDSTDATNGITVSNVAVPAVTNAGYDAATGVLTVTGTGFLKKAGGANDIDVSKLTLTGEGGMTHTLTDSTDVEINSGIQFTVPLSVADKATVNQFMNKNGTASANGTAYNLAAAEDWAAGADPVVNTADLSGNAVIVSGVAPATVTSVIVSPSTVSVQKGNSQDFDATIIGTNNPAQTVTWSVYGNSGGSTDIDAFGILMVAADEAAATLTVTATSTVDTSKSGTANVTVTAAPTTPPSISPTSVYYDLRAPDDVTINIFLNSATSITEVVYGSDSLTVTDMVYGSDYLTIYSDYIDGLAPSDGDALEFIITFDTYDTATLTVDITDGYTPPVTTYIVTFINDGSVYTTKTVNAGEGVGSAAWPADPTRNNYSFGGWFTGENGTGARFTSATPVNATTNLYAKWTNSGGSSGGGSGTPSTSTTPTYNADVKADNGTETTLPVMINKNNGSATVDIGSQNITLGGTVVTIPSILGAGTYSVGIPVPDLSTPEGQDTLTLNTSAGSVTVPSNMLTGVPGISGNKAEIAIGEGDKSSLPEDIRAAISDRPLVKLTLSIDGRQAEWSNPDAPVTVNIPYTPTAEELSNSESIVVWYIDGSGNVVSVPNGHYDPVTGTVTVDVIHFSDYAVAYNKVRLNDVATGAWYNKAVSFIAARKITTGTGGGSFSPEAKLTRGDFLVMLMKSYNIAPDVNPVDNFVDAGSTYYTGYLAAAKRLGISGGVGNNLFAPGRVITRQEMFTLLYNALKVIGQVPQGYSGKTLSDFSDAGQIAPWAQDAMSLLVKTSTVAGSNGALTPLRTTTRAEMAQVLFNLLGK